MSNNNVPQTITIRLHGDDGPIADTLTKQQKADQIHDLALELDGTAEFGALAAAVLQHFRGAAA